MNTPDQIDAAAAALDAEPQHTPGPWRIGTRIERTKLGGPRIVNDNQTLAIADVWDMSSTAYDTTANAALIAAAPDLLEALRRIADAWPIGETGAPNAFGISPAALGAARAAIAKAEGRV